MVSKNVVKLLNEQVALESESSNIYLAMAVWAEVNGWRGTAKFMYKQAEEERGHMQKLISFLMDIGEPVSIAGMKDPVNSFKDIAEVFAVSLKHELKLTASIHNIMTEARRTNDYAATSFLKFFVDEQVEEESNMEKVIDLIKKAGQISLYLADKEIGAMVGGA